MKIFLGPSMMPLNKKGYLPCARMFQKAFIFGKNGMGHHYRVIHKKEATDVIMIINESGFPNNAAIIVC